MIVWTSDQDFFDPKFNLIGAPCAMGVTSGPKWRLLDPGVSMFAVSEIRVAIVPVGPVPREQLEEYCRLIQRFRAPTLRAVHSFTQQRPSMSLSTGPASMSGTGPGGASGGSSAFQFRDWGGSGVLRLRFVQGEETRRRSRLADLHPHRQLVAVLGLLHCPSVPPQGLATAHSEFRATTHTLYPEARVIRCFAFEPSEGHLKIEGDKPADGLVMFPPGGIVHLEQHLEVWMHDLAAAIVAELDRWAMDPGQNLPRPPSGISLGANVSVAAAGLGSSFGGTPGGGSFSDSSEFVGPVPVMDEVARIRMAIGDDEIREKRRRGRMHKVLGDLCLMAGSPKDALNNCKVSQELAKATSDWVWCGAAIEGTASAKVLELPATQSQGDGGGSHHHGTSATQLSQRRGRSESASGSDTAGGSASATGTQAAVSSGGWPSWESLKSRGVEAEVRELLAEARGFYKKKGGVAAMHIEQCLKLARLLSGLHGRAARQEVLELVGAVQETAAGLQNIEDRVTALADAAQISGMVGAARRRSLLLFHATDLVRSAMSSGTPSPTAGGGGGGGPMGSGTNAEIYRGEMLRLKLALKGLEPPGDPSAQTVLEAHDALPVSGSPSHWAQRLATPQMIHSPSHASIAQPSSSSLVSGPGRGFASQSMWATVRIAALEQVLQAARRAGVPWEAWEAAASLLRHHHTSLGPQAQATLIEILGQASSDLPLLARPRPGLGPPCPLALLKRVVPPVPSLQPQKLQPPSIAPGGANTSLPLCSGGASAGKSNGGAIVGSKTGGGSPFIFNPNAGKQKELEQKQRGKRAIGRAEGAGPAGSGDDCGDVLHGPDWVCGEEGQVEVVLCNPLAVPVKVESISLHARYQPPPWQSHGCIKHSDASSVTVSSSAATSGLPSPPASDVQQHSPTASHSAPHHLHHHPSGTAYWHPNLTGPLVLPPGGKPLRMILSGSPLLPGTLTLTGLRVVAAGGVQWFQPFHALGPDGPGADHRKPSTCLGKAPFELASQMGAPIAVAVTVVPGLPLLRAVLRRRAAAPGSPAGPAIAVAPQDEELTAVPSVASALATAAAFSGATDLLSFQRSSSRSGGEATTMTVAGSLARPPPPPSQSKPAPLSGLTTPSSPPPAGAVYPSAGVGGSASSPLGPVTVWQGQRGTWELHLTNVGSVDVGSITQVLVTNSRGQPLKALPSSRMAASATGAHLEPVQGALAELAVVMPLSPGAAVAIPVELHVGKPPGDSFDEVVLEIRLSYTGPLSPTADRSGDSDHQTATARPSSPQGLAAPPLVLGRRLIIPVQFIIHPTVQVWMDDKLEAAKKLQLIPTGYAPQASSTPGTPSPTPEDGSSPSCPKGAAPQSKGPSRGGALAKGSLMLAAREAQTTIGGGGSAGSLLAPMLGRFDASSPTAGGTPGRRLPLGSGTRSLMENKTKIPNQGPSEGIKDGEEINLSLCDNHGSFVISRMGSVLDATAVNESSSSVTMMMGSSPNLSSWESGRMSPKKKLQADQPPVHSSESWRSGGTMKVALYTDCLMQVSVVSTCERYLRVWLERTHPPSSPAVLLPSAAEPSPKSPANNPSDPTVAAGSSSGIAIGGESVVLPPGEAAPLRCFVLPATNPCVSDTTTTASPPPSQLSLSNALRIQPSIGSVPQTQGSTISPAIQQLLLEEPNRLSVAELVCGTWSIAWRMIGLEDEAPHGSVQLSAVDVARMLSPAAVSNLHPSPVAFHISAIFSNEGQAAEDNGLGTSVTSPVLESGLSTARPRVKDLTHSVQEMGLRHAGEVWGIKMGTGEVVEIEVEVVNRGSAALQVQYSVGASNISRMLATAHHHHHRPMGGEALPLLGSGAIAAAGAAAAGGALSQSSILPMILAVSPTGAGGFQSAPGPTVPEGILSTAMAGAHPQGSMLPTSAAIGAQTIDSLIVASTSNGGGCPGRHRSTPYFGVDSGVVLMGHLERVRCRVGPADAVHGSSDAIQASSAGSVEGSAETVSQGIHGPPAREPESQTGSAAGSNTPRVEEGFSHHQRLSLLFMEPGLYQVYVHDVVVASEGLSVAHARIDSEEGGELGMGPASLSDTSDESKSVGDWPAALGRPVYTNVQRLQFLIQ